jgi:hypothetical protein
LAAECYGGARGPLKYLRLKASSNGGLSAFHSVPTMTALTFLPRQDTPTLAKRVPSRQTSSAVVARKGAG